MHFFLVDETRFQPLRAATEQEVCWYRALAAELRVLYDHLNRFHRVETAFQALLQVTGDARCSPARLQADGETAVANFLYAFNECLDQWQAAILRESSRDSGYYQRYRALTSAAFDAHDSYKITFALRNSQHTAPVVQGVSASLEDGVHLYAHRDALLAQTKFTALQRAAIAAQPEQFDLLPLFRQAKELLEQICIRLTFYPVTAALVDRAQQAVAFHDGLCPPQAGLLLGELRTPDEAVLDPEAELTAQGEGRRFTLCHETEIPWGLCRLLCANRDVEFQTF